MVNWFHGNGLWKLAKEPYEPLWIKGGGHCNLELYPDYIRHLNRFVQEMESTTTASHLKKIRQSLQKTPKTSSKTTNTTFTTNCCCRIRFQLPQCKCCSQTGCLIMRSKRAAYFCNWCCGEN